MMREMMPLWVKHNARWCQILGLDERYLEHPVAEFLTRIHDEDRLRVEKAVQAAAKLSGPVYLRLSRAGAPVIFDESYDFQVGKGVLLKEGKDVTLIATGALVQQSLAAAELLAAEGISAEVLDIHTIKPIDQELILASARKTGAVVTPGTISMLTASISSKA